MMSFFDFEKLTEYNLKFQILPILLSPPNIVSNVSQPAPSAAKNIAKAEAINHLEVYMEKMRAQIEKGRKHLRRFEKNDLVQIQISEVDRAGCQYRRLNEHYSAIKLVPISGTFREYLELIVISEIC
ncbi:957_t:CDS:2, partial [Scutellospora calospora]